MIFYIQSVITLTAIITNFIILTAIIVDDRVKLYQNNIFIGSMVVSDFLMSCFVVPFPTISLMYSKEWVYGEFACTIWTLVYHFCLGTSTWHLSLVCYDCYFALLDMEMYVAWMNNKVATKLLVIVWVVPFLGGLFIFAVNNDKSLCLDDNDTQQDVCLLQLSSMPLVSIGIVVWTIPTLVLLYCYINIFRWTVDLSQTKAFLCSNPCKKWSTCYGHIQNRTFLLGVTIVLFYVTCIPAIVLYILYSDCVVTSDKYLKARWATYFKSFMGPILLLLCNARLRRGVVATFTCHRRGRGLISQPRFRQQEEDVEKKSSSTKKFNTKSINEIFKNEPEKLQSDISLPSQFELTGFFANAFRSMTERLTSKLKSTPQIPENETTEKQQTQSTLQQLPRAISQFTYYQAECSEKSFRQPEFSETSVRPPEFVEQPTTSWTLSPTKSLLEIFENKAEELQSEKSFSAQEEPSGIWSNAFKAVSRRLSGNFWRTPKPPSNEILEMQQTPHSKHPSSEVDG